MRFGMRQTSVEIGQAAAGKYEAEAAPQAS